MKLANMDEARASVVQMLLHDCFEKMGQAIRLMEEGVVLPHKITVEEIQRVVCVKFGVTKDELLGESRAPAMIRARQLAMYVARQCTALSYVEIAEAFKRTHASVMSGIDRHRDLMETELEVLKDTNDVMRILGRDPNEEQR